MDSDKEKEGEAPRFKVNDRRRFDLDGTVRKDAPPDTPRAPDPPMPPPKAAQPPPQAAKPAPGKPQAAPPPGPPPAMEEDEDDDLGPPPGGGIDFLSFLQSLGQQALMQLGLVPYPDTGLVEPSLPMARQTIDILSMLQAKTRGNLLPKEDRFLEALVYDLRMAYVKVTEAAMKQSMPPDLKKGGPGPRR